MSKLPITSLSNLVCSLSIILFVTITTFPQNKSDIDSNLVKIPVSVLDRNGRYITDLKKNNFRLFENEVEQKIVYFEATEANYTVLFLLDTSGSLGRYIYNLTNAANTFIKQMPLDSEVIAIEYSHQLKKHFDATKVRNLKKGIKLGIWKNQTSTITFDAVDYALETMKQISNRKAIILFSDGELYGKNSSLESNLQNAYEQKSLIYAVHFGKLVLGAKAAKRYDYIQYVKKRNKIRKEYLEGLAKKTGGRYFQIDNIVNLEETFKQIAKELGQQYIVGFYPKSLSKKNKERKIKVKVNIPNVAVRARKSYIIGSKNN